MGSSQSNINSNSSNNAENYGPGNFDAFNEEKQQVRPLKFPDVLFEFLWPG